jgi:4-amino-4-deoxy-L-arabinose transferase-like glycosyltransferase
LTKTTSCGTSSQFQLEVKMRYRYQITGSREREITSLIFIALSIHLLMLIHDIASDYYPFLWGDRGTGRWEAMLALVQSEPTSYLSHLAGAEVGPGEYLLQLPSYLIGGCAGIIIFQILLSVLSTICLYETIAILLPWNRAPFICALIYLLIPQNIVFPHQFTTEAVATPFCAFFLYLMARSLRQSRLPAALWGAICYGISIFVRPSLALALPALLLLPILYSSRQRQVATVRAVAICAVASLPLALWVAAFTGTTGQIGYTSGVANLGWNLRSKVFLVYAENGWTEPPELARFLAYAQLYDDTGGISVPRYLEIVSEHPVAFAKDAVISLGQTLGRGNVTKFFIDYLRISADQKIKDLPKNVLGAGNIGALLDAMRGNVGFISILLLEAVFSLANICFVLIAVGFLLFALARPQKVSSRIGSVAFQSMLIIASILFGVIASSEIADAAQARLRNPVEAGLIILCSLFFFYRHRAGEDGEPVNVAAR